MEVVRPRVSYADLERTPEDGRRYELYDGEVFVVPSPLPIHQMVVKAILQLLDRYARTHGGLVLVAPLDIVLTEFDVVQPDVVFFGAARRHLVDPYKPTRHGPDIAVEVLSPSTAATDRGKKMQLLARHRVREYWLVDPAAERIEIHALGDDRYVLVQTASGDESAQSAGLPELTFLASSIFERH